MTICYLDLLADLTHFGVGLSKIMSENYWPCQPSQLSQPCVPCVPCAPCPQRIPQLLELVYFFASCATFPFFYFFGSRGHSPVGPLGRPCAALALHPTVQLWHRSPSLITTPAWGSAPPIPGGRIIAVTAKPWAEATTHYPHTKGLSWRAMEKVANPFKVTNIATGS